MRREPGQEHAVLRVTEPDGRTRVLLDPTAVDPTGRTTLDSWAPDLEGRRLAYQLSSGGDEHSVLHVLDVTTGDDVEPPIDRCRYSDVAWLPGGEELVFVRMVAPDEVPAGEQAFHRRIWRHRIGTPTETDTLDGPAVGGRRRRGLGDHNYYGVTISADGRWLLVTGNVGTARRDSLWIADLQGRSNGTGALTPILTQADDVRCDAWVARDGRLYLHTDRRRPALPPRRRRPRTPGRAHWRELVAEDPDSVLEDVTWLQPAGSTDPADGLLVLARSRHAVGELGAARARRDRTRHRPPARPGRAAGRHGRRPAPRPQGHLWIGWTDLVTPPQVRRFDLATGTTDARGGRARRRRGAAGAHRAAGVHLRRRHDRPHVRRGARAGSRTGPGPMLTGYGGFGISPDAGYSRDGARLGRGRRCLRPRLAARRRRGGRGLAPRRHARAQAERLRRLPRRRRDWSPPAGRRRTGSRSRRLQRRPARRGRAHPAARALRGGGLLGAAAGHGPLRAVRARRAPGTTSTAPPTTPTSWAGCSATRPTTTSATASPTRPCCSPSSTATRRVDPLHARKMCAALQHATSGDAPGRSCCAARRDVGHGARSRQPLRRLASTSSRSSPPTPGSRRDRTCDDTHDAADPSAARPRHPPVRVGDLATEVAEPVCATDPGSWCQRFYEWTDNDFLARSADAIVAKSSTSS